MVMRHTPSVFVGSKNKGSKQGRGERGEGRGRRESGGRERWQREGQERKEGEIRHHYLPRKGCTGFHEKTCRHH